jgi:primosomal protein N' (replication factor Y) (superfamily II helicase)
MIESDSMVAKDPARRPSRRPPPARLVSVAVFAAIRQPLTYAVPASLSLRPGQRVLVPLGTRRSTGVVLEAISKAAPGFKIREVLKALDPEPVFSAALLRLGRWVSNYYLAPPGEVYRAMLPLLPETRRARTVELTDAGRRRIRELASGLLQEEREGSEAALLGNAAGSAPGTLEALTRRFSAELIERLVKQGFLTIRETEARRGRRPVWGVRLAGPVPAHEQRLSPVARRIVEALAASGGVQDHRPLLKSAGGTLGHLKKLSTRGLIDLFYPEDQPALALAEAVPAPELSGPQAAVFQELASRLDRREFHAVLLHGVTASGKTEIYLRLIARCLERGQSALMLVPEIALTPAAQSHFLARFPRAVALLHSGLSDVNRHEAWWRVRRGEAKLVLGTRSAIFAPIENPGVIIVDEEHEASYKQEETPRYNGRDVAVVRARLERALVVLGSATPSLESYSNAQKGKYQLLTLTERIANRPLATVEIADMREEFRETHSQIPISRRLREEIEAQLRARGQTMILLNRRGYSWFLLCRSCGQTERCQNCSISLTYHKRQNRLVCHYCGFTAAIPARCSACGSEYLYYVGEGTEKLEDKFAEMFPSARVARLDRDAARRPEHFHKILDDFRAGRIDILVGTQLIAKGHDFAGVTLVGVVSADTMLALPDFHSAERTFQLLTQAAGRAGRGEAPGRVLVQTFYPGHYAIRLAAEQNYPAFFAKEIRFRRALRYPPAAALANVVARDQKLERAARIAHAIGKFFEASGDFGRKVRVLGPSPAPLARIKGMYRIQFILKSESRSELHAALERLAAEIDRLGIPPRAVIIDPDPLNLM